MDQIRYIGGYRVTRIQGYMEKSIQRYRVLRGMRDTRIRAHGDAGNRDTGIQRFMGISNH